MLIRFNRLNLINTHHIQLIKEFGFQFSASPFPAGYNNLDVAEFLLEHGADVNAQDKGGLIPLHNASSYGHLDIAALLIKYSTVVNATDKWGFTPLHEAAQKCRTQLCALLLAHGADPFLKNQEGQSPVDLATADDVHCLLQDAMASQQVVPSVSPSLMNGSSTGHSNRPPSIVSGAVEGLNLVDNGIELKASSKLKN